MSRHSAGRGSIRGSRGAGGAFWEMHDLIGYAEQLGLDVDRLSDDLEAQPDA